jgi:hypothetical protein
LQSPRRAGFNAGRITIAESAFRGFVGLLVETDARWSIGAMSDTCLTAYTQFFVNNPGTSVFINFDSFRRAIAQAFGINALLAGLGVSIKYVLGGSSHVHP